VKDPDFIRRKGRVVNVLSMGGFEVFIFSVPTPSRQIGNVCALPRGMEHRKARKFVIRKDAETWAWSWLARACGMRPEHFYDRA